MTFEKLDIEARLTRISPDTSGLSMKSLKLRVRTAFQFPSDCPTQFNRFRASSLIAALFMSSFNKLLISRLEIQHDEQSMYLKFGQLLAFSAVSFVEPLTSRLSIESLPLRSTLTSESQLAASTFLIELPSRFKDLTYLFPDTLTVVTFSAVILLRSTVSISTVSESFNVVRLVNVFESIFVKSSKVVSVKISTACLAASDIASNSSAVRVISVSYSPIFTGTD